ncbi:hypothetical protein ROHU_023110 [Labeo rohita]|uniref:DUF6570 domain-containing protein n=1 Tax=Labeo rohita TaxID=84645 RepID=A0A498MSX5_LABRO|nr:hypothetical protein ROHU_023110 [Labeo rohita]
MPRCDVKEDPVVSVSGEVIRAEVTVSQTCGNCKTAQVDFQPKAKFHRCCKCKILQKTGMYKPSAIANVTVLGDIGEMNVSANNSVLHRYLVNCGLSHLLQDAQDIEEHFLDCGVLKLHIQNDNVVAITNISEESLSTSEESTSEVSMPAAGEVRSVSATVQLQANVELPAMSATKKNIPFMKMLALPRGGQNGVHEPVTCVPSNVTEVVNVLPRSENDDFMIRVKLKRKLTYKGHYDYKFVNSDKIKRALVYLNENNKWYADVEYNNSWTNPLSKIEEIDEATNKSDLDISQDMCVDNEHNTENEDEITDETLHDRQQHGLFMDSCLQPVDIAQEVLDQHFDGIMSLAPAEGNNPVRLFNG